MLLRSVALALALFSVSGCIIVDTGGPVDTRPIGYPVSRIAIGLGVANAPDGYTITASSGSFRVTWTGFQEFEGSVWIASGTPRFVAGCSDNSCSLAGGEDRVYLDTDDPRRIDFDSFPISGKRSGFDLLYTGDLVFDIFVNGARRPDLVVFPAADLGGQIASAPGMPFGLTM